MSTEKFGSGEANDPRIKPHKTLGPQFQWLEQAIPIAESLGDSLALSSMGPRPVGSGLAARDASSETQHDQTQNE